jgi:AcrR family transcriptional regulator
MSTEAQDKILDAAIELFAQRGYTATTTRAIAEGAGVNESTLFRRFGNKQGVLKALGGRLDERSADTAVQSLPDPADVRGTLVALAREEIQTAFRDQGVALRLAFDARAVPEVGELMGEGPRANLQGLAVYFRDRRAAGAIRNDIDPEVLAEAFSSLTSSYVMYRVVIGVLDKPEDVMSDPTIEQLVDVFLEGAARRGRV